MKHNRNYINELNESLSISLSLYQALSHYPSLSHSLITVCQPRLHCESNARQSKLWRGSCSVIHNRNYINELNEYRSISLSLYLAFSH